jgi:hypothetical protein
MEQAPLLSKGIPKALFSSYSPGIRNQKSGDRRQEAGARAHGTHEISSGPEVGGAVGREWEGKALKARGRYGCGRVQTEPGPLEEKAA